MSRSRRFAKTRISLSREDADALLSTVYSIEACVAPPTAFRRWIAEIVLTLVLGFHLGGSLNGLPDLTLWRAVMRFVITTCLEARDSRHQPAFSAFPARPQGDRIPLLPNGTIP